MHTMVSNRLLNPIPLYNPRKATKATPVHTRPKCKCLLSSMLEPLFRDLLSRTISTTILLPQVLRPILPQLQEQAIQEAYQALLNILLQECNRVWYPPHQVKLEITIKLEPQRLREVESTVTRLASPLNTMSIQSILEPPPRLQQQRANRTTPHRTLLAVQLQWQQIQATVKSSKSNSYSIGTTLK